MAAQDTTPIAVPSRRLVIFTAAAAVVATVVMFGFVLPAEYGYDPTGFGRLTGLTNIAASAPETVAAVAPTGGGTAARAASVAFRTDTIDIPLPPDGELEYKVQMKAGDSIVYSWDV